MVLTINIILNTYNTLYYYVKHFSLTLNQGVYKYLYVMKTS